jgi:hypothetical protein
VAVFGPVRLISYVLGFVFYEPSDSFEADFVMMDDDFSNDDLLEVTMSHKQQSM